MSVDRAYVDAKSVANQTSAMLDELERRWPGAAAQLRQRTLDVLSAWPATLVRTVPESDADAECTVAGAYLAGETPPILAVAQSLSRGRRAFTALHELGHHIQQTSDDLVEVLWHEPDDGRALEEAACNSFAADILIPAALVHRHIDETGPTAHTIVSLWADPAISASRAAVCARAAERLRTPGHVVLLDAAGTVTFGSSRGFPPLRRGSDQSRIAVVRETLPEPTRAHAGSTALAYRDGITGQTLTAQAKAIGAGHIVLVAVTDHSPWAKGEFHLPSRDTGPKARWWACTTCDHLFPAFGARCNKCGAPHCPQCGQCDCKAVTERLCVGCFLKLPLPMFDGGSDRCRDCA